MRPAWLMALEQQLEAPQLFDEGVEAARNACVAGASIAAAAITAAAWYDNPLTGLPALTDCMTRLSNLQQRSPVAWHQAFAPGTHPQTGDPGFSPGFGCVSEQQAAVIVACCERVIAASRAQPWPRTSAYLSLRPEIERVTGPLNTAGMAALLFVDRGVSCLEAERHYLCWRIATAIAEAQKARAQGVARFPFFGNAFEYEGTFPPATALDLEALKRRVGLD